MTDTTPTPIDPMLRAAADAGYLTAREYAEEVRRRQEQERARAAA